MYIVIVKEGLMRNRTRLKGPVNERVFMEFKNHQGHSIVGNNWLKEVEINTSGPMVLYTLT